MAIPDETAYLFEITSASSENSVRCWLEEL